MKRKSIKQRVFAAFLAASMVTLSGYAQYITKAGTYNIKASNVSSTSYSPLIIESTSESTNITLNIQGNITVNSSKALIYVTSPCNLTINGNGYTIKNSGSANVIHNPGAAKITITGGTLINATTEGPAVNNTNGGTITITGGKISGYRALQNSNSYAYIQGGEIGETNQSTASYIS